MSSASEPELNSGNSPSASDSASTSDTSLSTLDRAYANGDKIKLLEQQYIEQLERRIQALERANKELEPRQSVRELFQWTGDYARLTQVGKLAGIEKKTPTRPRKQRQTRQVHRHGWVCHLLTEYQPANPQDTPSASHNEPGRVRYKDSRLNAAGIREETDSKVKTAQEAPKPRSTPHAITLLRHYDDEGKYDCSEIKVEDEGLQILLLDAFAHLPWYRHGGVGELYSPFEEVIHCWTRLQDLSTLDDTKEAVVELRKKLEIREIAPGNMSSDQINNLQILRDENVLKAAANDLKLLLDEVKLTPELQYCFAAGKHLREKGDTISYNNLWTIFAPGDLVYSTVFLKQPQLYIVQCSESTSKTMHIRSGKKVEVWRLYCWTYDWDGTAFNRVLVHFDIESFKGDEKITSLPCYPWKCMKDENRNSDKLMEQLIERGKKFCQLCLKPQIVEYDGMVISHGTGSRKIIKAPSETRDDRSFYGSPADLPVALSYQQQIIQGRVMVDFKSYIQHAQLLPDGEAPMGDTKYSDEDVKCSCVSCEQNIRLNDNQKSYYDGVSSTSRFDQDIQWAICPARVLGYYLDEKRWVELNIASIKTIGAKKDPSGFKGLEMGNSQKELIRNLVMNHARERDDGPSMTDLTQGKGNGLVILLHGPPGVGKTLTAESVARVTGKPLFPINVSDIGLHPSEVEHNLGVLFELGAAWKAVMLFDEADVFLESRSSNTADLGRNSLVSILLRILEFYSGILILTTNRIRSLDVAVQSRINFAIRYENLSPDQKRRIFKNFISQLTDDNANKSELVGWIDDEDNREDSPFKRLNGRQIRNVLFSAASLASGEPNGKLRLDHVKKILRETQKFQDDVNSIMEQARKDAEVGFTPNKH